MYQLKTTNQPRNQHLLWSKDDMNELKQLPVCGGSQCLHRVQQEFVLGSSQCESEELYECESGLFWVRGCRISKPTQETQTTVKKLPSPWQQEKKYRSFVDDDDDDDDVVSGSHFLFLVFHNKPPLPLDFLKTQRVCIFICTCLCLK